MNTEFISALKQIEKDRNIPLEVLIDALQDALAAAYKRNFGTNEDIVVEINRQNGQSRVFSRKLVVEEVVDATHELSLEEAQLLDDAIQLEEEVLIEVTPTDFGRIAAQTAKQVIVQRIREAERDIIFADYEKRVGDIISGTLQRYDQRNALIDLGKAEGVLPASEMSPHDHYRHGERVRAYVTEVRRTPRGPQVLLSRSHPALLKRMFELEVPEIRQGLVAIKAVVREPGFRSKIAVKSNDPRVDPVGACVGPKAARVQVIVDELRGERIDIVEYNPDPSVFISNALSPARVLQVVLHGPEKSAIVVVPDLNLSMAIGKEGQNARLAAKLTGWKIDIKNETQWREIQREEEARRAEEEARRAEEEAERARIRAERIALGLPIEEEPVEEAAPAEVVLEGAEPEPVPDFSIYLEEFESAKVPQVDPINAVVPVVDAADRGKKKKTREDEERGGPKKRQGKGPRRGRTAEEEDYDEY